MKSFPLLIALALSCTVPSVALGDEKAPRVVEAPAVKSLVGTVWNWHSGGTLRLLADGVASHSRWTKTGTWKRLPNGKVSLKNAKMSFDIVFLDDGSGVVTQGKRSTTIIRIDEVKGEKAKE